MHKVIRRTEYLILLLLLVASVSNAQQRIVKQRPVGEGVRWVQIDDGFMVAYDQRIPGTDIAISMVPVEGGILNLRNIGGEQVVVKIEPFWMGKYETTYDQFNAFAHLQNIFREQQSRSKRKDLPKAIDEVDAVSAPTTVYDPSYRFENVRSRDCPIVTISQFSARQFTKFVSLVSKRQYRLPSEAEWEYACRAGSTTTYHFGNDVRHLNEYASYSKDDQFDGPPAVGSLRPNQWGLHDMHGSVMEWVLDGANRDGLARLKKGRYTAEQTIFWPQNRQQHVLRGGGWLSSDAQCTSASRMLSDEEFWNDDPHLPQSPWWLANAEIFQCVGFRILSPLKSATPEFSKRFYDPVEPGFRDDIEELLHHGYGVMGRAGEKIFTENRVNWVEQLGAEFSKDK